MAGHKCFITLPYWERSYLPTSLTSACRIGPDRYAIVGKKGTLLIGSGLRWQLIPPGTTDRIYWDVDTDGESLYVTHEGGIDQLVDGTLQPLIIPNARELEFFSLSRGPDGVWAFAGQTIGVIRNGVWNTILS